MDKFVLNFIKGNSVIKQTEAPKVFALTKAAMLNDPNTKMNQIIAGSQ